jgi:hypothetical protein
MARLSSERCTSVAETLMPSRSPIAVAIFARRSATLFGTRTVIWT